MSEIQKLIDDLEDFEGQAVWPRDAELRKRAASFLRSMLDQKGKHERGITEPNLSQLRLYCKLYHITADHVLNDDS